MPRPERLVTVLMGAALLGGCGGTAPSVSPASSAPPAGVETPPTVASTAAIPDGTYESTPFSRADIVAAIASHGLEVAIASNGFADVLDGFKVKTSILRLTDGRLQWWSSTDGVQGDLLWNGAFRLVDEHTLVADDTHGAITLRFARSADGLRFTVVDDLHPDAADILYQIAFYEPGLFRMRP